MKIEDQVCSLNLSRKLKELGIKNSSYFFWIPNYFSEKEEYILRRLPFVVYEENDAIPAFTVAELGAILPDYLKQGNYWLSYLVIMKEEGKFVVSYDDISAGEHTDSYYQSCDKNLANAMAQTLIHLLENKLIEVQK